MKDRLFETVLAELRARFDRLTLVARESHAAATDPSSKAESKYDTRSLEASYLAAGQARQLEEFARDLAVFEVTSFRSFDISDPIAAGALVEVELGGESQWFLLAPAAGGVSIQWEDREVTLLTPESPLYAKLLGLRTGDSLEEPVLFVSEVI